MDGVPSCVFEPVDVPSTYEETISRLGNAIRIGVLAPGTRLPPERELAERLGISRSTLRQALAALTDTGHLIAVRGRSGGTFVAAEPPLVSPTPIDLKRSQTLLDWRMALELGAVRLAATRADAAATEVLRAAAEPMTQLDVLEDWTRFRRADAVFHLRLAEAGGSDRILAAVTEVHAHLCDLFDRLESAVDRRQEAADQHLEIVAAVAAGDVGAACEAMHDHVNETDALVGQLRTSAA